MEELESGYQNPEPSNEALSNLLQNYQSGRYELAEKLAKDLVDKFPQHPFGWKVLGVLFRQTDRISQAITANQKLVVLTPGDAGAHNNLGNALLAQGNLEEAKLSYEKSITLKLLL